MAYSLNHSKISHEFIRTFIHSVFTVKPFVGFVAILIPLVNDFSVANVLKFKDIRENEVFKLSPMYIINI